MEEAELELKGLEKLEAETKRKTEQQPPEDVETRTTSRTVNGAQEETAHKKETEEDNGPTGQRVDVLSWSPATQQETGDEII